MEPEERPLKAKTELSVREVIGTITVRPEGYGFLKRIEGVKGDDVFLPPEQLRGVMDGDRLKVELVRGRYGREAGLLVEILDRRRRHLLGTFYRRGGSPTVLPVDPTLPRSVRVEAPRHIRDGQVVKVAITQYPEDEIPLLGRVEKVIGEPGDPVVEVLEVAYSHGFAEDFPGDVRSEAERLPDHVLPEEKEGRRDLTDLALVTIDGADARDFDDAVLVQKADRGGYRLMVAIADVAHYVTRGTRLDEEALQRATSVYFPNYVLPMLPERLSNGICSLNPDVDRLSMVADITFDSAGTPVGAEIYEGVMRSHARCTYEQVAAILEGGTEPALAHVHDDIRLAGELARKLRQRRTDRGSLDFEIPEVRPVLDEDMHVVDIVRRDRNDAHRLIEEFMLAANEAVARHFSKLDLPSVYRVHAEPDPDKLQLFVDLAQAVGFDFTLEEGITPVRLGKWLRSVEGSPQQKALNTLMLRAMMQAIYSPENIGHFGLGAEHYLHFTSPIRRYPDLTVHRLLKQHWAKAGRIPTANEKDRAVAQLEEVATQSSQRERAAMEAEREISAFFKCVFVQDKVGEVFDASIVGVTDFGFFAEIDEFPVDGLVRADELGTGWDFDEQRHRLLFPATGLSFGVGDKVKIEISGVDLLKRQIGFMLVADQEGHEVVPAVTRIPPRSGGRGFGPKGGQGRGPAREERRGQGGPGRQEARHGGPSRTEASGFGRTGGKRGEVGGPRGRGGPAASAATAPVASAAGHASRGEGGSRFAPKAEVWGPGSPKAGGKPKKRPGKKQRPGRDERAKGRKR